MVTTRRNDSGADRRRRATDEATSSGRGNGDTGKRETRKGTRTKKEKRVTQELGKSNSSLFDRAYQTVSRWVGLAHWLLSEAYLICNLTFILLKQLFAVPGKKWIFMLLKLLIYATFLLPGFVQVGLFYYFSKRVSRSIVYGPNPRNRLDIYRPADTKNCQSPLPVVIFITGGAWIIGYKAWGSLLGKVLSQEDLLVVSLDYRNFPQGTIRDMLDDVDKGIEWVFGNIRKYGGDQSNVTLVGQSAGAHLASLSLIECATNMQSHKKVVWTPLKMRAFVGVSGAYDLVSLSTYLSERGLHVQLLNVIMSVNEKCGFEHVSPLFKVQNLTNDPDKCKEVVGLLPPVVLMHGKKDETVPFHQSVHFRDVLERAGVSVELKLYENETHTTPLIENPLRGSNDELSKEIINTIRQGETLQMRDHYRMVPETLIRLAEAVSPF
mmetsp:Transcript_13734/g.34589  ORF Transcript_13734/g.34589 Transcript_13734/m.34589 type:complete len:437 (-) Transcript_13734:1551-2861(-)